MAEKAIVALVRCEDYDYTMVSTAVKEGLKLIEEKSR